MNAKDIETTGGPAVVVHYSPRSANDAFPFRVTAEGCVIRRRSQFERARFTAWINAGGDLPRLSSAAYGAMFPDRVRIVAVGGVYEVWRGADRLATRINHTNAMNYAVDAATTTISKERP